MFTRNKIEEELKRLAAAAGEPQTAEVLIDSINEEYYRQYDRGVGDGYDQGGEY